MHAERATFSLPLPNDFQGPADYAPALETDVLGQKRRISSCKYNWLSVHLMDIKEINRGIDPEND